MARSSRAIHRSNSKRKNIQKHKSLINETNVGSEGKNQNLQDPESTVRYQSDGNSRAVHYFRRSHSRPLSSCRNNPTVSSPEWKTLTELHSIQKNIFIDEGTYHYELALVPNVVSNCGIDVNSQKKPFSNILQNETNQSPNMVKNHLLLDNTKFSVNKLRECVENFIEDGNNMLKNDRFHKGMLMNRGIRIAYDKGNFIELQSISFPDRQNMNKF
ncbi:hypothetical protein SNEBB_002718 [Seison nebaliae]|nr:hypothetical protein SNEBB_002718 [Seison nebaliae]